MQSKRKWWCLRCAVRRGVLVTEPSHTREQPACPECGNKMVRYGGKAPLSDAIQQTRTR